MSADFVRDWCRALDTHYDREAVELICNHGVFATGDPSAIESAAQTAAGIDENAISEQIVRLEKTAIETEDVQTRRTAYLKIEGLWSERHIEIVDAVYLLGIAVGRRLGAGALTVPQKTARKPRKAGA